MSIVFVNNEPNVINVDEYTALLDKCLPKSYYFNEMLS